MKRLSACSLAVLTGACVSSAPYRPAPPSVPRELTWHYQSGLEVWAADTPVAAAPHYTGLGEYLRCSAQARDHGLQAEHYGDRSTLLSGLAIGGAVVGLGGLSGLAFNGRNDGAMAALLLSGVAIEITAVVLGGRSRGDKVLSNGHAVDAVNYYNDAVAAGTCAP